MKNLKTFEKYRSDAIAPFDKYFDEGEEKEFNEFKNFRMIIDDILEKFEDIDFEYVDLKDVMRNKRYLENSDIIKNIEINGDLDSVSLDMEDENKAIFGFRIGGKGNKNNIHVYKPKDKSMPIETLKQYQDLAFYTCKRFQLVEFAEKLAECIHKLNYKREDELWDKI
jgi:hypothetical protein